MVSTYSLLSILAGIPVYYLGSLFVKRRVEVSRNGVGSG
jgi:hypothetical protein